MVVEILVAALFVTAAYAFYTAGRLLERTKRLKDRDEALAKLESASRAYQNKIVERRGYSPLFDETGVILTPVPVDSSPPQILRPPFAQAEINWEEEEENEKPLTAAEVFKPYVPELTDAQKAEMRAMYPLLDRLDRKPE